MHILISRFCLSGEFLVTCWAAGYTWDSVLYGIGLKDSSLHCTFFYRGVGELLKRPQFAHLLTESQCYEMDLPKSKFSIAMTRRSALHLTHWHGYKGERAVRSWGVFPGSRREWDGRLVNVPMPYSSCSLPNCTIFTGYCEPPFLLAHWRGYGCWCFKERVRSFELLQQQKRMKELSGWFLINRAKREYNIWLDW